VGFAVSRAFQAVPRGDGLVQPPGYPRHGSEGEPISVIRQPACCGKNPGGVFEVLTSAYLPTDQDSVHHLLDALVAEQATMAPRDIRQRWRAVCTRQRDRVGQRCDRKPARRPVSADERDVTSGLLLTKSISITAPDGPNATAAR